MIQNLLKGGWNVSQYFNTVFKFDTETETWSEEPSLLKARGDPGVSLVRYDQFKKYCQNTGGTSIPFTSNTYHHFFSKK